MDKRVTRAFVLALLPVVAPCLFFMLANAKSGDEVISSLFAASGLTFVCCCATLFVAVPIHVLLQRMRKTDLVYYIGLAVLPVILFGGVLTVWRWLVPLSTNPFSLLNFWSRYGIRVVLVCAIAASSSAAMFWYAGVRQPRS